MRLSHLYKYVKEVEEQKTDFFKNTFRGTNGRGKTCALLRYAVDNLACLLFVHELMKCVHARLVVVLRLWLARCGGSAGT